MTSPVFLSDRVAPDFTHTRAVIEALQSVQYERRRTRDRSTCE